MNIIKYAFVYGLVVLLVSCAGGYVVRPVKNNYGTWMPQGALRSGTITDERLMADALLVAVMSAESKGNHFDNTMSFTPFVAEYPRGRTGARSWREIWVFGKGQKRISVKMRFLEQGRDATFVAE